MRIAILVALVACGNSKPPAPQAKPRDCVSPVAHGAIVDDGKDDRVAVQAAIDEAAERKADVCLPTGRLDISRVPGKISSLLMPDIGIGIRGVGEASVLAMLGQAHDEHHRDWWLLQVTGDGHRLQDFAMDGTNRDVTDEQTHLIQLKGPASNITIERLVLAIPRHEISKGGDCIRMLGERDTPVRNVTISHVRGVTCARSFIAFQRWVMDVMIDSVISQEVGGGAIDMEPTGTDGAVHRVTIKRSELRRGFEARGGYTVSLAGGPDASTDLVVEDSIIEASIQVYRVHGGVLRNNKITGGIQDRALIKVQKDSKSITIANNILVRDLEPGAAIELTSHNGLWPSDIVIRNNEIVMHTDGFPIHGEPVEKIEVSDNTVRCERTSGDFAAVFLRGVLVPITEATVRNNEIRGRCTAAVRISQHEQNVTGNVVVENNRVEGTQAGVIFENGAPRVRPIVRGNVFKGVVESRAVVGADARLQ